MPDVSKLTAHERAALARAQVLVDRAIGEARVREWLNNLVLSSRRMPAA